jgi:branched-chain amino acid transport system permease protein
MNLTRTLRSRPRGVPKWQEALVARWQALPRWGRWIVGVVGVAYLYLLPSHPPPFVDTPGTSFAGVLASQVVIFVIAALGLNVVVGLAGLLDLGYVGFYAVGAYVTGVLSSQHGNLPWLLCLPISVLAAMLAGVILGTPTLRLRGDYLAIVTLGFGEIIRISANNSDWLGGSRGITSIPHPPDIGPITFGVLDPEHYYWLGLSVIIVLIFFLLRLERSRVGRAWTAIREDEDAAELMGVPTFKFKLWAFAIGAGVGGLAGNLYASQVGFINPDNFPFLTSILFLAAVVLGGSGNIPGVIVGAAAISYLPERLRNFADKRVFVFGVALILVMVFRPQGLLPKRQRAAELTHTVGDPTLPGTAGTAMVDASEYAAVPGEPDATGAPEVPEDDLV